MLRFQKNKPIYFITLLLLICLSAIAFHFLVHATHHGNDSANPEHCVICQFVTAIGAILFCVFLLFLRLQRTRFSFLEIEKFLPVKYLSAISGRAPPSILS